MYSVHLGSRVRVRGTHTRFRRELFSQITNCKCPSLHRQLQKSAERTPAGPSDGASVLPPSAHEGRRRAGPVYGMCSVHGQRDDTETAGNHSSTPSQDKRCPKDDSTNDKCVRRNAPSVTKEIANLLHFSHWPLAPRPLLCRRNRPITPPVGRR